MRYGVTLPHYELGRDGPDRVSAYALAAEQAGLDHLAVNDHVMGADQSARPDWQGYYNSTYLFHESFVLFGFLAALTTRIEFVSQILILPQRQTALVAKQAAEVDVLSHGRLRLGVGIGWNPVEYGCLGIDFASRGARFEEQVEVLRLLWSQESVTYQGRFHDIDRAGILPLPVQRPIPLWFGGGDGATPRALQRIGRLADGWVPNLVPGVDDEALGRTIDTVRAASVDVGRDADAVEINGIVQVDKPFDGPLLERRMQAWIAFGATRLTFRGLDVGYTFDEHIDLVHRLGATYREDASGEVAGGKPGSPVEVIARPRS
jgi:probable F420-dependent oxidoreductase